MALKQVEDNYEANTGTRWAGTGTTAPATLFRLRNELAGLLEEWAIKIGAEREIHAEEFAERLLVAGWSK
jgi:hypothetical protein